VYEAEAYNAADGCPVEIQIIECADDAAAIALAEEWSHTERRGGPLPIRLYKLPAFNDTSCHSLDFWPDMKVVTDIPALAKPNPAAAKHD
jgi:hypothetical protein